MARPVYNEEEAQKRLDAVKNALGSVPPVNQILSVRPDMFCPTFDLSDSLFRPDGRALDVKTRRLIALACAAAVSGEYCMKAQMTHAKEVGATADEVLEALEIAAYTCMTRSQSYSLREFARQYGVEYEEPEQ